MRRLLPLILAALPLPGCCSLARLWCGPDRSPWISVDFTAPERTVRTLLEALRRDDPDIVYLCLADDYRQRLGLDAMTTRLAWERVRNDNPGLHLAGYADVPGAIFSGREHARVDLDVEGQRIEVELVRQSSWDVRFRRPDGSLAEVGAGITSWVGFARVEPIDDDSDRSRVALAPLTFRHDGLDEVPLDALERVGLERRWKIADIRSAGG